MNISSLISNTFGIHPNINTFITSELKANGINGTIGIIGYNGINGIAIWKHFFTDRKFTKQRKNKA